MAERYKITVLGDRGVGKTALTLQYVDNIFPRAYIETISHSYRKLDIIDQKSCTVEIIDTGAFELVKILQPALLDSSQGAIFVYDAFNRPSFRKLHDYYLPLFVSVSGGGAPITLVGNRTDKSAAVQVPAVEARELADKYGAAYFEIPATSSREVRRVVVNHIRNMRKARGRLPLVQQSQAPTHPRDQAKQSSAPAAIEAVAYQKQLLPPLSRFADKPDGQVQGRTYSQSELRSAFDEAETFTVWSFLSRWVCGIG